MSVSNNVTKTIFYWNNGIVFKSNWKIEIVKSYLLSNLILKPAFYAYFYAYT